MKELLEETQNRNEILFGCAECDIHVPEQLRETFSEMCPIFKNTEISRDDIGSMVGKKILFTTPLLKWYLEHGLQVRIKYRFVFFLVTNVNLWH